MKRASDAVDGSMDELDESTAVVFERLLREEPQAPAG